MFVLLPVQLLYTSALLHYDASPPVDRVHLLEDRTHITSAIPETDSRLGRLRVNGNLTLTIPKNTHHYRLPAQLGHGICEVKVKVVRNESLFGYVPATAEEMQLQL